jgi:uncharacterized protein (DUF1800 family)
MLMHAIHSEKQLQEMMTWFWENHFSTNFLKHGNTQYELDENNAFRANALGKFRDLLEISAKSPAMLIFLDGIDNVKAAPNENYSRELLELHSMGVNGGYTQTDVDEVARVFTGWTVQNDSFFFDGNEHDNDPKTVLGQTFTSGGILDGEEILDLLAAHPSTANFICTKLVVNFVSDSPPASLVNECAATFQSAGQSDAPDQIAQALNTIFTSTEFQDTSRYQNQLKRPLEFVVSSARVLQAPGSSYTDLVDATFRVGMSLFENPSPEGFSIYGPDWITSTLFIERIRFVNDLAYNGSGGGATSIDPVEFFRGQGYETAEGIAAYLLELTLAHPVTELEWTTAVGILTNDGQATFDVNASDADNRLRALIGTVLGYPGYAYR